MKLTWEGKLKRIFTSDEERYSLKYTIGERVARWILVMITIVGLVGTLLNFNNNEKMFMWAALSLVAVVWFYMLDEDALKRRIKELGGDIFHKENKKEETK